MSGWVSGRAGGRVRRRVGGQGWRGGATVRGGGEERQNGVAGRDEGEGWWRGATGRGGGKGCPGRAARLTSGEAALVTWGQCCDLSIMSRGVNAAECMYMKVVPESTIDDDGSCARQEPLSGAADSVRTMRTRQSWWSGGRSRHGGRSGCSAAPPLGRAGRRRNSH